MELGLAVQTNGTTSDLSLLVLEPAMTEAVHNAATVNNFKKGYCIVLTAPIKADWYDWVCKAVPL